MPKARGERWYDNLTVDDSLHDAVQGNADRTASREVLQVLRGQTHTRDLFCIRIARRVRVTHVNVVPNPSEPSRSSGQVLCEILVEEGASSLLVHSRLLRCIADMVDEHGNVAVGCLTFLVDLLTTLALVAQGAHVKRTGDYVGVSQAMQFVFHAPAPLYVSSRRHLSY